ncbi:MAG: aldehyde dehydrogenase family protein [Bacteroidales bacterium]
MKTMLKWYLFGEERRSDSITVNDINEVMTEARKHTQAVRNVPEVYILDVLDRVGRIFGDTTSARYADIVEKMNKQLGWSKEMVMEGLETISDILTFDNLKARLEADIDNLNYLDEFTYNAPFKGMIKAEPFGVVSHVSAGNVFVGAVDTLVQGLITKNVNILKMSSADPLFPLIFAEVLKEVDYKGILATSFALVPFKGGDKEVEAVVKQKSDVLVVYGGEETVKAYREGTGFHTKIIEYGPKYSLAMMSKACLNEENMDAIAHDMARDFTMWEQSACSSPHAVFIDDPEVAAKFAKALAKELAQWAKKIPHSKIPTNEAVEIQRTRELTRVDQALGEAQLIIPSIDSLDWTVVLQQKCEFKVSPHHRTAYVIVSPDHEKSTLEALGSYGQFIQSVALLLPTDLKLRISDKLVEMGADRITEIGMMTRRKHGTPHDGTRGTSEMVRWVSMGSDDTFVNPFDYLEDDERDNITLMRLNAFLRYSRQHSSFYSNILPDADLKSLDEIATLPVLSPAVLKENLPPKGTGILTTSLGHSISFGSGGTTGDPKFIHRTNKENHENAKLIGKGYALSIFDQSDVVANLLFAGNMWASFLSHNEAVESTGAHVLPIAGNIALTDMISVIRAFKPTGAISIPSVILSIAEYVDKNNLSDVKIKKIVTGGEHLFPEAKAYIAKVLGTEKFASTGYLSNDTGCIGFQCEACHGPTHHIHEDYCLMEVVHPETNEPLPDGESGKILVTNFSRNLMPLIRYDIGDMGAILTHRCSCGRKLRLMKLEGRSDDTLIIGGGNIQLESISGIVGAFDELSYHFRMIAEIENKKDKFILEVETINDLDASRYAELSTALYDRLLKEKHEFLAFMKSGSIVKPEVRVVAPNSLPRNPRTGKLKQTLDKRDGE